MDTPSKWRTRLASLWGSKTPDEVESERGALRKCYGTLFDKTSALLFKHDPIGINFEDKTDEYESEARTILPRLEHCRCIEDTVRVVHEEFVRWFDATIAGPPERYAASGADLWQLWQGFLAQREENSKH